MVEDKTQLIRFLVSGGVVALVYLGGFVGLERTGAALFWTNLVAFSVSVLVQYVLQTRWTFRRRLLDKAQSVRFVSVIAIGLSYSSLIVSVLAPKWAWNPALSAGFVCVSLPVLNFAFYRLWVYRGPQER